MAFSPLLESGLQHGGRGLEVSSALPQQEATHLALRLLMEFPFLQPEELIAVWVGTSGYGEPKFSSAGLDNKGDFVGLDDQSPEAPELKDPVSPPLTPKYWLHPKAGFQLQLGCMLPR